jgi:hypothetical protein
VLWTLLVAISSFTFVGGALMTAHRAGAGFGSYPLLVAVGFVLAISNFWAWSKVAGIVTKLLDGVPEPDQKKWLLPLYVVAGAWGFVAAALSYQITSALLRFAA